MKKKYIFLKIIFLLVALIISAFCLYIVSFLTEPVKKTWAQTYYLYLKEKDTTKDMVGDIEIEFYQVNNLKNPVLALKYEKDKHDFINLYYIDEKEIKALTLDENTEIEYLYNIDKDEYNYYIHREDESNDYYLSINECIKNDLQANKNKIEYEYTFAKEKEENVISDYEKTFIEPDIDKDKEVSYKANSNNVVLKQAISKALDSYKEQNDLLDDEEKREVKEKLNELATLIEKQKEQKLNSILNSLYGTWYKEYNDYIYIIDFYKRKDTSYISEAYYASEGVVNGAMEHIDLVNDNYLEFTVYNRGCQGDDCEIEVESSTIIHKVNLEKLADNKIIVDNVEFKLVDHDSDKAYKKLEKMYYS